MSKRMRRKDVAGARPSLENGKTRRTLFLVSVLAVVLVVLLALHYGLPRSQVELPELNLEAMEPQVAAKIQEHREAVLASPTSSESWAQLARVLQAHGLEEEAAFCYLRALEGEPDRYDWHYLLAHAVRDRRPEDALAHASRASVLNPDYAATYVLEAQLLEESNETERAFERYQKAVAADPQCTLAHFGLGRIYLARRELEPSLTHLRRAAELDEDAAPIHASLAQVYRRLGDREAAMREARLASELKGRVAITDPVHYAMRQESVSSIAQLQRAMAADKAGNYPRAETIYRQLLEIRPDDANIHARLADTLARQEKRREAKEHYLAALEINAKHASALYGLGNVLSFEQKYEEAARRYEESLAIRPDHIPSLLNLGSLLAFQGKLEEAATQYQKGLEIDPNHFGCHRQLGQVLIQQRKLTEAIVHFRAALQSRPDFGPLHTQLAMALATTGDFRAAWRHVKEAERLGESLPPKFLEALRRQLPDRGAD